MLFRTESRNKNDILEAHLQTSRFQWTAAHPAYRSVVSKDPKKDESTCLTGVYKGLFKILSDSFGGKAGTTLNADQDEGAMVPMDFQGPELG